MIGIGPINITPPVCTSEFLEVDCNAVPTKTRITPRNITIIPALLMYWNSCYHFKNLN